MTHRRILRNGENDLRNALGATILEDDPDGHDAYQQTKEVTQNDFEWCAESRVLLAKVDDDRPSFPSSLARRPFDRKRGSGPHHEGCRATVYSQRFTGNCRPEVVFRSKAREHAIGHELGTGFYAARASA